MQIFFDYFHQSNKTLLETSEIIYFNFQMEHLSLNLLLLIVLKKRNHKKLVLQNEWRQYYDIFYVESRHSWLMGLLNATIIKALLQFMTLCPGSWILQWVWISVQTQSALTQ